MLARKYSPFHPDVLLSASADAMVRCAACRYFNPDDADDPTEQDGDSLEGDCDVVHGDVQPWQVCRQFSARPVDLSELEEPDPIPMSVSPVLIPTLDGVTNAFQMEKSGDVYIVKADDSADEGLVFGWANVSLTADGESVVDAHGDEIPIVELEKAAYGHVLEFRATGVSHAGIAKGQLVESVVFTPEKLKALGLPAGSLPYGWWIGYQISDPEVFKGVKDGTYRSFSIQGLGQYEDGD